MEDSQLHEDDFESLLKQFYASMSSGEEGKVAALAKANPSKKNLNPAKKLTNFWEAYLFRGYVNDKVLDNSKLNDKFCDLLAKVDGLAYSDFRAIPSKGGFSDKPTRKIGKRLFEGFAKLQDQNPLEGLLAFLKHYPEAPIPIFMNMPKNGKNYELDEYKKIAESAVKKLNQTIIDLEAHPSV